MKHFLKSVVDVSVSLDNELLIASSLENKAVIWRLKTMRIAHTLTGHNDVINACRLTFSKKQALTGSLDRTIKFWDIESGICTRTVRFKNE